MAIAGRKEKTSVKFDFDEISNARQSALTLVGASNVPDVNLLLDSENLDEVEKGIVNLNEMSRKAWLLSSILLYTLVYNADLYTQSGLSWEDYVKSSKTRLNMSATEINEQLTASKFFIKHHQALANKNYKPTTLRSLARAQLAVDLSGDVDAVIEHLASGESYEEFKSWYSKFKPAHYLPPTDSVRNDIEIKKDTIKINGVEPVKVNDDLPQEERIRLQGYLTQIYMAIKDGYEPAIVPVYDRKEAVNLIRLRDKYRQGK